MAGLIAYGTAGIVSAGRTPMGTWQKRSRRDRLAALGQVSRSVPVTCAVSDGYSARILNERRVSVTPCLIGEDAPRGRHRRPARRVPTAAACPRPTAVARLRPADQLHATTAEVCGRCRRLPPKGAGPALTDSIHYRGCCRGAGCLRPGRRGSSARRCQALTGALRNPQARCAGIRIRPLRRCPPRADPAS